MPDQETDETEAPAFAGAEPLEDAHGDDALTKEAEEGVYGPATEAAVAEVAATIRDPEPDNDDDDDEAEEVAPGSPAGFAVGADTTEEEADAEAAATAAEEALQTFEEAGIPSMDTDHELAAYWSGYRAGGDDPGYLLTLAELNRHLGSFFEPEEAEAFDALSREDFWSRWMLGYLDAAAGRMARPKRPRTAEEMDF